MQDKKIFEDAYKFCGTVTHVTELSFEKQLQNMEIEGLEQLSQFLKHDRTKNELKLMKVAEFAKDYDFVLNKNGFQRTKT